MGFWGVEVKPGKAHPYHSDNVQGTLYITQATLGLGSSHEKSILQCTVGHKNPIFLCTLLPDKIESCSLNLEFKDELVAFSVIGPRSIHLSGYFVSDEGDYLRDEYESDSGEDIADTETDDESSEYDYDDELDADDFIDDEDGDLEMFPRSPVPNSGVVIEEIMEDDNPTNGNFKSDHSKNKKRSSDHEEQNNSEKQIVAKPNTGISVLESEDEDGFPVLASQKEGKALETHEDLDEKKAKRALKKAKKKEEREESHDAAEKKRKVESIDVDDEPEKKTKKKKQKKKKQKGEEPDTQVMDEDDKKIENTHVTDEDDKKNDDTPVTGKDDKKSGLPKTEVQPEEAMKQVSTESNGQGSADVDAGNEQGEKSSAKKKKKKKKNKTQVSEEGANKEQGGSTSENKAISGSVSTEDQLAAKPSNIRSFSNGLVIEDLAIGKPDGKRASPGSKVSVRYIGKLKKNGDIFDSNMGRAPFKFRLGVGQVIKGWDVGVNGMRVGDKRRLTIPPSMGYGDKRAGPKIPPNSWLVFDVELVDVN